MHICHKQLVWKENSVDLSPFSMKEGKLPYFLVWNGLMHFPNLA